MLTSIILLSTLLIASALALPSNPITKRDDNFNAGNCQVYWVANRPENTPIDFELLDANGRQLVHNTEALLPSYEDNHAYVLVAFLDRWVGIQSQPDNKGAMLAYGTNTRLSMDPHDLSNPKQIPIYNKDTPQVNHCIWTLPNDRNHPNSKNLIKCIFPCGPGY